ncbi:unnamed protein product [Orchesella dallaii]|uniref:F-box domain-containing protein n=1 Tax=Orchesella dallaii TaxID=48710 RepID=A0ABP1RHP6_9HEXA
MPVTSVLHYVALFGLIALLIFLLTFTFKFIEWLVEKWKRKRVYSKVDSRGDLEVGLISSVICDKHEYPSLPLELWFEILEHVNNPQDFLSCINTFPVWNRVLGHRKTKELISLVFPHFEKYLDTPSLLQCRLVSTHWKSLVDDTLGKDEEIPTKSSTYSPGNFLGSRSRPVGNKISSIEQLQRFPLEMEPFIPSNPFPSRNLQISVSPLDFDADEDLIDYYGTLVTQLVTTFGHHLHKLNYTMKVYEPSSLFPQLLHFLPNVQHLTFTIPFLCTANYAEVVGQAYQNRMPSMPCLKSFHLNTPEDQHLAPKILKAFLQNYGDRLETLTSYGGAFGSFERDENSSLLPTCKNLTVGLVDDDTCRRLFIEPRRFTWNLSRLCLLFPRKIDSNLQGGKVKLESILRGINPVAATLEELQLCLNWRLKEWGTPLYLEERKEEAKGILGEMSKFPKLKTLVISDDFMEVAIVQQLVQENFVGLERFVIDMGIYDEYFRGRRMYEDEENPLWKLRPTLKIIERVSLTVEDGVVEIQQIKQCSREQYEVRWGKVKNGNGKSWKSSRIRGSHTVSRVINMF